MQTAMQVTSMSIHFSIGLQSHTNQDAEVIFTHFHKKHKHSGPHVIFAVFPEDLWGYKTLSQCMYRVLPCPFPFYKVTPLLFEGMGQPTLTLCKFASKEIYPEATNT